MPTKPIKLDDLERLCAGDTATPVLRDTDAGPVYLCEIIDAAAGNRVAGRLTAEGYTPQAYGVNIVVAAQVADVTAMGGTGLL